MTITKPCQMTKPRNASALVTHRQSLGVFGPQCIGPQRGRDSTKKKGKTEKKKKQAISRKGLLRCFLSFSRKTFFFSVAVWRESEVPDWRRGEEFITRVVQVSRLTQVPGLTEKPGVAQNRTQTLAQACSCQDWPEPKRTVRISPSALQNQTVA